MAASARCGGIERRIAGTLVGLLVFADGGLGYYAANGYSATRFKVDYRAAAHYLAARLHPEDTVVFIDESTPRGGCQPLLLALAGPGAYL